MQHGTGREYIIDRLEGALAIVNQREVWRAIEDALRALNSDTPIDERGAYGPDYGLARVTPEEKAEATVYALGVGVSGVSKSTVGRIDE